MSKYHTEKGWCNLCGTYGDLSEEHVPPRQAFNNQTILEKDFREWMKNGEWISGTGTKRKQSIKYTLCEYCNNFTSCYAQEYVKFARQACYYLDVVPYDKFCDLTFIDVRPLRLIKSIVTMIIAVNSSSFRNAHPELINFVMNREQKGLPEKYKIHLNLVDGTHGRLLGVSGQRNINSNTLSIISSVDFKPLSSIISFNSDFEDMFDIRHFSNFSFKDKRDDIRLKMKKGYINSPYPGDYKKR